MKKLFTAILTAVLFFGITAAKAGEMIKFATYGGPEANAYYIPGASGKVVIMFHDWNGLTSNVKKDAEKWYEYLGGGATIYVVDLFDGKTALTEFEGKKLMKNLDPKRAEAMINGLIEKIGTGKQIATVGFGIGGTWAFNASAILGEKSVGCGMIYGIPAIEDVRIAQNKADVVYIGAVTDDVVNKADAEKFKGKVAATGRSIEQRFFDGKHGFANSDGDNFVEVTDMESRVAIGRFLKHKLAL